MGIEAVTKRELEDLGYPDSLARNGRVEFRAGAEAIARCNIGLRSATRVLIKVLIALSHPLCLRSCTRMSRCCTRICFDIYVLDCTQLGEFQAATFDELFDGVYAIPWGDVIHAGAAFPVRSLSFVSL